MSRQLLLKALIAERFSGSQADFARAIKRSPAQVNQWLTGNRKLGEHDPSKRACPSCARLADISEKYCPSCGHNMTPKA